MTGLASRTELRDLGVEPLAMADPLASLPGLELELQHRWMVWDAWTQGKRRVDVHPFVLSPAMHHAAMKVASHAWDLVQDAGKRGESGQYHFHPDVERLANAAREAGDTGSMVRVDLLLQTDGTWIACEVNADCPGGYNETVALPHLARAAGARLPTPLAAAAVLADALVAKANGGLIALAYATGYAEDLQVCAIVERLVRERGGRTVRIAPTALKADGDGVAVRVGGRNAPLERVAVLYRFYPTEYMAGQKNLDAIVRAIASGSLHCLSSFAHIHAQSKLAMARAFEHDPRAGEAYPETFAYRELDRGYLLADRENWVIKRDLSRVGDHVYVGSLIEPDEFAAILDEVSSIDEGTWIAQRFVKQRSIPTPWGERLITLGVYLLDGAFAGYYARFSPTSHCSHDALVLPVFVRSETSTQHSTKHEEGCAA